MPEPRFFQPGDRVTFRPDRADAYGTPRGAVYTVVRTYPHKRHKRTWVVLSGLPNNEDGSPPTVDSRELRYAPSTRTLRNAGVPDEGPAEHIRNALAILLSNEQLKYKGGKTYEIDLQDASAIAARLRTALRQLEQREHVYMGLPRRGNRRSVRRGNPALAVLGNPRVADATLATWAKIEYMRPDDPDGNDVVRVHEFRDGFEIAWLDDGSVQLSHPRHPLWTDDES